MQNVFNIVHVYDDDPEDPEDPDVWYLDDSDDDSQSDIAQLPLQNKSELQIKKGNCSFLVSVYLIGCSCSADICIRICILLFC